jgi:predicted metalloendopeptidase
MAYYYSLENAIKFPAAFLQGVFFSADRPQYTNYGGVGIAIGHEITHGFDDVGSQFDAVGNLRDWWGAETRAKFLERTQCFVNQFASYVEPATNLNVNGINTLGENIADNGGVKYAYRGYQKWVKEHGEEPKLPGVKYNQNQLFWISFGQQWCAASRDAEMRNKIVTGIHSPERFRTIGPIHNLADFSKDFNCPERSPMNPVDKCEAW